MKIKTSETYRTEVLEKYKRDHGGEMGTYLTKPTRSQIRDACIWLVNKRVGGHDDHILNHFFQFVEGKTKMLQIKNTDPNKFLPVVNFLKGKTNNTSIENLELISWMVDFQPRPLQKYLRQDNSPCEKETLLNSSEEAVSKGASYSTVQIGDGSGLQIQSKWDNEKSKGKGNSKIITITISIILGIILVTTVLSIYFFNTAGTVLDSQCMTWAGTHFKEIRCSAGPYSEYGTEVVPFEESKFLNLKKVEVTMATDFFAEGTNRPLIWYSKGKQGEVEFFTSSGLHPVTGKTLDEITPYIIQKYVPMHSNTPNSFVP